MHECGNKLDSLVLTSYIAADKRGMTQLVEVSTWMKLRFSTKHPCISQVGVCHDCVTPFSYINVNPSLIQALHKLGILYFVFFLSSRFTVSDLKTKKKKKKKKSGKMPTDENGNKNCSNMTDCWDCTNCSNCKLTSYKTT